MTNQSKAYFFAVLSVFLWSTSASAFKITLRYETFSQLMVLSVLSSLIALFIVLLLQKKINLLFKMNVKQVLLFALLGFLNPFAYYLILFKAYSLIPAQLAQPLNFVWPIMTVLVAIPVLKQKIRLQSFAAILISFFGVVIISTEGHFLSMKFDNPYGIFLALSSSVVWAIFWVLNIKSKADAVIKLFYLFFFGLIYVLIYFLLFTDASFPDYRGFLGSVYIGFFEMGFTFVAWYYALAFSQTTATVNNLVYVTPFLSLIFIALAVGEKILLSTIIGLVFILAGIIFQNIQLSKKTIT